MNSDRTKLRQEQHAEQEQSLTPQSTQVQSKEFSNVEDLLRYDSEQNPVPDEVALRLNAAIAAEPKAKSWFKSLFGS
jgi:hypothetical protein